MPPPPKIEPLDIGEQTVFAAWQEAVKKSIDSADSAAETIVTASFSIATAYGALIGLVAPKDEQAGLILGLPFGLFALAAVFALASKTQGVPAERQTEIDAIMTAIEKTSTSKRKRAWLAILSLIVALIWAGVVVVVAYGNPGDKNVTVRLTKEAATNLTATCQSAEQGVKGDFQVQGDFLELSNLGTQCGDAVSLRIAKGHVAALVDD